MPKKTNITLKLDSDLLRKIKVVAATKGTSVSSMLTTQLEGLLTEDDEYEQAKKRAITLMQDSTAGGWRKPKSRDDSHER
jgi:hypothetical protein